MCSWVCVRLSVRSYGFKRMIIWRYVRICNGYWNKRTYVIWFWQIRWCGSNIAVSLEFELWKKIWCLLQVCFPWTTIWCDHFCVWSQWVMELVQLLVWFRLLVWFYITLVNLLNLKAFGNNNYKIDIKVYSQTFYDGMKLMSSQHQHQWAIGNEWIGGEGKVSFGLWVYNYLEMQPEG